MTIPNYKKTKFACFFSYLSTSSTFILPAMLFVTFHETYGVSYTLLGTLVLVNFCTQFAIDLIFTFLSKHFNIRKTTILMPLLTSLGLSVYAILPSVFPEYAFVGLVIGTMIFSVASGLNEVLLSPIVAAIPSDRTDKDLTFLHSLYGWGVLFVVATSSLFFHFFGTEKWAILTLFFASLPLITSILFATSPTPPLILESEKKSSGRSKGLLLCVACIFLGSAAENSMTNWISGFMEKSLGLSKATGDILGLAVFALLLTATRTLYAKFTPDITKTLFISMTGAAICYVITGFSQSVALSFLACILVGVFSSMLWPGSLIFLEERVPSPGVAAYALMAAGGDFGASVAPQLVGVVVDKVSVMDFAKELALSTGATAEEIGLKVAMLFTSVFPIAGALILGFVLTKSLKKAKT